MRSRACPRTPRDSSGTGKTRVPPQENAGPGAGMQLAEQARIACSPPRSAPPSPACRPTSFASRSKAAEGLRTSSSSGSPKPPSARAACASRARWRSAASSRECQVVVNLAPADVKKTGSGFDLAIAAAAAAALGHVPAEGLEGVLFVGELSLEGTVQPLRGVLPQLLGARARGVKRAVVPRANAAEAALVEGVDVRTVGSLGELMEALRGGPPLPGRRRCERDGAGAADARRSVRGARAGRRAARARDRRGRRTQPPDDRPSRRRQDDARARVCRALAAAVDGGRAGGDGDSQRRRAPVRDAACRASARFAPRTTR